MDEFCCDYECRTVGECIAKYNVPDDWCAEFDAYDSVYPRICIQVAQIRKVPAMMELKLRMIENADEEYAGCILVSERKCIAFKIDCISELIRAAEITEE